MYICMYVYVYMHAFTYTCTHIYVYTYTYMHTCIFVCIYIYICIYIFIYILKFISRHRYIYKYFTSVYTYVFIYAWMTDSSEIVTLHLRNQPKRKIVTFLNKFKLDFFLIWVRIARYRGIWVFRGRGIFSWFIIHIHSYIYTYIHTNICAYDILNMYMYLYMYVYIYIIIFIYVSLHYKFTLHMIICVKFEKSRMFYTYLRICEQSWLQRIACRWRNNVWLQWNLWVSLSFVTFKYIPTHPLTHTPTYTRLHFVFFTHTDSRMLMQYKINHYCMFSIAFVPRDNKVSRFHVVLDSCFNLSGICYMQTCTHMHNTKTMLAKMHTSAQFKYKKFHDVCIHILAKNTYTQASFCVHWVRKYWIGVCPVCFSHASHK